MSPDDPGTRPPTRRAGRRRAWIVLAGLLVILVAAGAFLAGRATSPGPAVVVVSGGTSEEIEPVAPPLALIVPGMPTTPAAVFTPAPELADTSTTATGYRLTSGGLDGADVAGTLASALGLPGEVREFNDGWIVGGDPGPTLQLSSDPYLSWTLTSGTEAASGVPSLTPARAQEIAADLLGGIGVDLQDVDWQVDRLDDRVLVTAWQMVDDSRTGLSWTIGLDGTGALISASGIAAGLEPVPGYDVVGAATAVRRAAAPTWATLGPRPIEVPLATPSQEGVVASTPPAASAGPDGRPALAVPLSDVVVTDAELSLAQYRQPDGSVLLLPTYLLTGSDGSRWTLLGVSEDYVDFIDVPYPSPAASDG